LGLWRWGKHGASTEGVQVKQVYNQPGSYNVALTVTDDQGLQGSSSLPVQIYPVVEAPDFPDLEGKIWMLVEAATFDTQPITAFFGGGTVRGFSGCNTYNANYQSDGSNLTISNLTTTQAVCDGAATTREAQYLASLGSSSAYQVQGDQLTLLGPQPLTFTELVATPAASQ
jgi:heat shock protein HslJ